MYASVSPSWPKANFPAECCHLGANQGDQDNAGSALAANPFVLDSEEAPKNFAAAVAYGPNMSTCQEVIRPTGTPSIALFLVHGTFAPNATWTMRNSKLCAALLASFPDAAISVFPWTGRNSHLDRIRASTDLAHGVDLSMRQYPTVPHVIIAHSHGGNIALTTAEMQRWKQLGVVCLSTPVLRTACRRHLTDQDTFIWLSVVLMAVIGIFLDYWAWPSHFWLNKSSSFLFFIPQAIIWAVLCIPVYAGLVAFRSYAVDVSSRVPDGNRALSVPVTFLGYTTDEAAFFLRAFAWLQDAISLLTFSLLHLSRLAVKVVNWFYSRELRPVLIMGMAVGFFLLLVLFSVYVYGYDSSAWLPQHVIAVGATPFFVVGLTPLFLMSASMVLTTIVLVLSIFLILVGIVPFGFQLASVALWVDIRVLPALADSSRFLRLTPPKRKRTLLWHSLSYQDPIAIQTIIAEVAGMQGRFPQ
jgi:hypothetical protein